jgi:hypothetical protein
MGKGALKHRGKMQKDRNKQHSPQKGNNKWLSLFSAVVASSVPKSERMRRECCSNRAFSELLKYAGEGAFPERVKMPRQAKFDLA